MKSKFRIIILILSLLLLQGCSYEKPDYIHFQKKPSLQYYTNEIMSKILNNEYYSLEIYDKNVSKIIKIDDSEKIIIADFINNLTNDSYLKTIDNSEIETEVYQLRIKFKNSNNKYIINIYNDETITIFPWDGIFNEDYISMKNVPARYNLFNFCNYVKERIYLNQ